MITVSKEIGIAFLRKVLEEAEAGKFQITGFDQSEYGYGSGRFSITWSL